VSAVQANVNPLVYTIKYVFSLFLVFGEFTLGSSAQVDSCSE
jgi:hypothetical protein